MNQREFPETESSANPTTTTTTTNSTTSDVGFECSICLDLPQDPVVTPCGHLFCWPCLHRWLHEGLDLDDDDDDDNNNNNNNKISKCPLCRGSIKEEELIPLYLHGRDNNTITSQPPIPISIPSRTSHVPNRPAAPRREAREMEQQQPTLPGFYFRYPLFEVAGVSIIPDCFLSTWNYPRIFLTLGTFVIISLIAL